MYAAVGPRLLSLFLSSLLQHTHPNLGGGVRLVLTYFPFIPLCQRISPLTPPSSASPPPSTIHQVRTHPQAGAGLLDAAACAATSLVHAQPSTQKPRFPPTHQSSTIYCHALCYCAKKAQTEEGLACFGLLLQRLVRKVYPFTPLPTRTLSFHDCLISPPFLLALVWSFHQVIGIDIVVKPKP